jgi:hypothetical protein
MRPSLLGACLRYAWEEIRIPETEKPPAPIGKQVLFESGHAAEHAFIRLDNELHHAHWTTDVELDNGYGGVCHPDAVDYERRVIAEIKFTGYHKPAKYHVAQLLWYLHRMSVVTGEPWTGEIILLSKYGDPPQYFTVPTPTEEQVAFLKARAEAQLAPTPPRGICTKPQDAANCRYYDALGEKPRKGKGYLCPYAAKCFPPPDDMEV